MLIVHNNVLPEFLKATPIIHNTAISSASKIRFYYRGGRDVVVLTYGKQTLTVCIPPFSSQLPAAVGTLLTEILQEIRAEMASLGIQENEPFLFDMGTKKCPIVGGFMDFIPYFGMKGALFVLEHEDVTENVVRFCPDASTYGVMQFLSLAIAKRELRAPKGGLWTRTGKQLLAFLAAERFFYNLSFQYDSGPWDSLAITEKFQATENLPVDLGKMKISRATVLYEKLASKLTGPIEESTAMIPYQGDGMLDNEFDDDNFSYIPYGHTGEPSIQDGDILLSEVLEVGIDNFFTGAYTQPLEVIVDTLKEIFASIILDTLAGVCLVVLNKGISIPLERLKEDLGTESVEIVLTYPVRG